MHAVGDENYILPYWLSNASTLLCLLQRNLRSNSNISTPSQYTRSYLTQENMLDGSQYPALLFKQQLTACVEKIFGLICDKLKKEISPLLGLCIKVSKIVQWGVLLRSLSNHWEGIAKLLDSLMSRLSGNYVPPFFIRKLISQVFRFINVSLFNSLLLRHEHCTLSNAWYKKSGVAELERWIVNVTEEFAGTSGHELNHIRQAISFLLVPQKKQKSLQEIRYLCPALTVRQLYQISTRFWDDKVATARVLREMRDILSKDSQDINSNSFLLDDDLSIPFSTEDMPKAIPVVNPSDVPISVRFIDRCFSLLSFMNILVPNF